MDWILSKLNYNDVPAFFLAVGASYYICAILFQGARPLVGTWVTYTVLTGLTAYGMYEQGALTRMVVVAIILDVVILWLAMRRGKWRWDKLDRWCFGTAAAGGALSFIVSSPNLAIATGVLATTAAAIPTAQRAFLRPANESAIAYVWFMTSSGFAIMQLPSWAFAHSFQPIMWYINGAVTFLAITRSRTTLRRCINWYRSKVPRKHRRA